MGNLHIYFNDEGWWEREMAKRKNENLAFLATYVNDLRLICSSQRETESKVCEDRRTAKKKKTETNRRNEWMKCIARTVTPLRMPQQLEHKFTDVRLKHPVFLCLFVIQNATPLRKDFIGRDFDRSPRHHAQTHVPGCRRGGKRAAN